MASCFSVEKHEAKKVMSARNNEKSRISCRLVLLRLRKAYRFFLFGLLLEKAEKRSTENMLDAVVVFSLLCLHTSLYKHSQARSRVRRRRERLHGKTQEYPRSAVLAVSTRGVGAQRPVTRRQTALV